MKNKKLALLLAAASLNSNLSAEGCNTDVSNQVAAEKYINQQDEKTLGDSEKKIEEKTNKSKNTGFMQKTIRVGGTALKWSLVGIGTLATIQSADNYHNSKAKKEYLSLINEFKALPYNERLDKFLETSKDLISKYEKISENHKKKDTRTSSYVIDRSLLGKSKDDMNNVPFGRLKDGKQLVCADFTYILQSMAQELGLICYNLLMFPSKGGDGHSVLMIAQKRGKKFNWLILDGANYSYMHKFLESHNNKAGKKYPKISLTTMVKLYKLDMFGYDKMYVVKNSNCIFVRDLDAKNEMVAILNKDLLNNLEKGYDVNWADDSYVKCFEQIEKDKS